jgi:hypothetical protein
MGDGVRREGQHGRWGEERGTARDGVKCTGTGRWNGIKWDEMKSQDSLYYRSDNVGEIMKRRTGNTMCFCRDNTQAVSLCIGPAALSTCVSSFSYEGPYEGARMSALSPPCPSPLEWTDE